MQPDGEWREEDEGGGEGDMPDSDHEERGNDEEQIEGAEKLFAADFEGDLEEESDGGGGDAGESGGDIGVMAEFAVEESEDNEESGSGQDEPEGGAESAERPAEFAPDNNGHVGGVETGEGLPDFERAHEVLIGEPFFAIHNDISKVGDETSAKTRHSDEKKGREDFR